ncbi:IS5 family transposase, partial [Laribacter hongkongensis]|uniref:IS5 family transposase n=1 Tax=Laribacter hongkongensis TaxID=168471 RepID=UPI0012DF7334
MNPHKLHYRPPHWPEYNRSLQNRSNLTVWLSPHMTWLGGCTGANGWPAVYTDAVIQTVLTLKLLFKLALRQARGLVCSLLKLPGLEWPAPCFSTVSRRQATLTVTIPVQRRTEPLHPLVDSTGLNICGEGEWKVKKHGTEYRRTWRKVHLAIDAETLDVRAVEMTGHRQGDTTQAEELLSQLDPAELLASVSGDGAYDTRGFFYREVHSRGPRSSCHHDGT